MIYQTFTPLSVQNRSIGPHGQRKIKKPTNEIEYYKKNIKAESVLDHCNLSDKIRMDISKFEIARNRIRPAGSKVKGLKTIDFLVREGNMSFQAAKSVLELLSQDNTNLKNKNMPKPAGKEAQEPAKQSSPTQNQQKKETKLQPKSLASQRLLFQYNRLNQIL